eukprot:1883993-Prymnesium_polylepis.1
MHHRRRWGGRACGEDALAELLLRGGNDLALTGPFGGSRAHNPSCCVSNAGACTYRPAARACAHGSGR